MSAERSPDGRIGRKLAPYTPSAVDVLTHACELLRLTEQDTLFDLGCGDARLLTCAAKLYRLRCVGVEYDAELVSKAQTRVQEEQVGDLVQIIHGDASTIDLTEATTIFMYLVPEGLKALLPKLEKARLQQIRIVTYVFSIPGWEPSDIRDYKGTKIYLYTP